MRFAYRISSAAVSGVLLLLAALACTFIVAFVAGYRPLVVLSGSMAPKMPMGSLAFVKVVPASSIKVGDVVSFQHPMKPGALVTHRIVRIIHRPGRPNAYLTKGDHNPTRDPWAVQLPGKVGKRVWSVRYAGYLAYYTKDAHVKMMVITGICGLMLMMLLGKIWGLDKPQQREQLTLTEA